MAGRRRAVRLVAGGPWPRAGRKAGDVDFFVGRGNAAGEYTNRGGVV